MAEENEVRTAEENEERMPEEGAVMTPEETKEPIPEEKGVKTDLDVFISYSTKNKNVADAVVANFEQHGVKCWYAPRDILPGQEWVSAIKAALHQAKIFVLIYTQESNSSRQVMNEVAMAFNAGKTIIPFRLTEGEMNDELEYYLTRVHWLDAVSKPMEKNIDALRKYVEVILQKPGAGSAAPAASAPAAEPKKAKGEKKKSKVGLWISLAAAAILLVALGVFAFFKFRGPNKDELMATGKEAFYYGNYGTEDDTKAREAFDKAAQAKVAEAYYYLGMLDERNYDFKAAKENYEKGIEAGNDLCKLRLGYLYQRGYGVKGDDKKAWELYNEALDNGCVEADFFRAKIVSAGLAGQELSAEAALKYLKNVAEESKDPWYISNANNQIGNLYKAGGIGVDKDLDKAIEYYSKLTETMDCASNVVTQEFNIGQIYANMDEEVKAEEHYKAAFDACKDMAEAGSIYHMYWCGYCCRYGKGAEQSYSEAVKWYEKANAVAKERNDKNCCFDALLELGDLCERGLGFNQNYETAYSYYKEAADAGCGKAAYKIGLLYHWAHKGADAEGNADYEMARQWYDKAIECGNTDAYTNIGVIYENGLGKYDKDPEKALEYYTKGAEMGNSMCMYNMGLLYARQEDYVNAAYWYQKAAELDNADAQLNLGVLYARGNGVEKDLQKAVDYYLKAANNGSEIAMSNLASYYYNGTEPVKQSYEEALKWYEKSARKGYVTAMYWAGYMYKASLGTDQDGAKAKEWLTKAAEKGDKDAMYELAMLLLEGAEGIEKDATDGYQWLLKAADHGIQKAYDELGYDMYYGKKGIKKDQDGALSWLKKSAEGGKLVSTYLVGDYYRNKGDYDQGFAWIKKSIDAGYDYAYAYLNLGRLYREGKGTEADREMAAKLYELAYDAGAKLEANDFTTLTWYFYSTESSGVDEDKAFKFALAGAENGDGYSMAVVAGLYERGDGTEVNYQESLRWNKASIDAGSNVDLCKKRVKRLYDEGHATAEEVEGYLPE